MGVDRAGEIMLLRQHVLVDCETDFCWQDGEE
jgi:hypothetical protein